MVGDLVGLYGIFNGVVLFLLADLIVVLALIAFPAIILYLPRLYGG